MTGMTIRAVQFRSVLFLLGLSGISQLCGQYKDFRTWYEIEVNTGLKNGIDLSAELEQRLQDNSLRYDRTLLTLSADYRVNKYLDVGAGARGLLTTDGEENLQARYRLHGDASGRYSLEAFDLSLRMRLQYGFDDLGNFTRVSDNSLVNRNRIRLRYRVFGTRVGTFVSVESFHFASGRPARRTYKARYSLGGSYTLTFRSEFGLRYILEDEFNVPNPLQAHILVFSYSYNL